MNVSYKVLLMSVLSFSSLNAMEEQQFRPFIPRISGRILSDSEWLNTHSNDLHVKVVLNREDPIAREANEGKFQPVMLSEVKRIDRSNGDLSPHVVLLEQGSHIEFQIKGKGKYGFGYKISTDNEEIVKGLYRTDDEGKNEYITSSLRRYQDQEKTLMVDNFRRMEITAKNDKGNFMFCNIEAWELEGFTRNEPQSSYLSSIGGAAAWWLGSALLYPISPYLSTGKSIVDTFSPYISTAPEDVKGDGIHQGVRSESTFGSISNVKDGKIIGNLHLQFLICANHRVKEDFLKFSLSK